MKTIHIFTTNHNKKTTHFIGKHIFFHSIVNCGIFIIVSLWMNRATIWCSLYWLEVIFLEKQFVNRISAKIHAIRKSSLKCNYCRQKMTNLSFLSQMACVNKFIFKNVEKSILWNVSFHLNFLFFFWRTRNSTSHSTKWLGVSNFVNKRK